MHNETDGRLIGETRYYQNADGEFVYVSTFRAGGFTSLEEARRAAGMSASIAQGPGQPAVEKPPKGETPRTVPTTERLFHALTKGPAPTPWDKIKAEIPAEGESARALARRISRASQVIGHPLSQEAVRKRVLSYLAAGHFITLDSRGEAWRAA